MSKDENIDDNVVDENEDTEHRSTTLTDVIGEFLYKFKSRNVREISEQISKYYEAKLKIDAEHKRQELLLRETHLRARAKLAFQYQWIRGILLICAGSAVTYLIINKSFDSASALFFGGLVAYLFGKEPK